MIAEPTKAKTEFPQISRRNNESPYDVVHRFTLVAVSKRIAGDKKAAEILCTIKDIECSKEEDSTDE